MRFIFFWTAPLIGPAVISEIASRPQLSTAGMVAVELSLIAGLLFVWHRVGVSLRREWRQKVVQQMFDSAWTAKLDGETFVMLPADDSMREKIREGNKLVMDIGKVKEPA